LPTPGGPMKTNRMVFVEFSVARRMSWKRGRRRR